MAGCELGTEQQKRTCQRKVAQQIQQFSSSWRRLRGNSCLDNRDHIITSK